MSSWRNKLPSSHDFRSTSRARNRTERVVCVVNPKAQAGRAGERMDVLKRAVDKAFEQWEVIASEGPGHATELTAQALASGADIVAAVGGDGTCNEVVNGFFDGRRPRRRSAVFCVIPWGTGSDLRKSVRAPVSLDDALWVASTGMTLPTDVGHVVLTGHDGAPVERVFLNVAGFGANGDVVERANKASKRLGGRLTFLQATLGSLLEFEPPKVQVTWEGPEGDGSWDAPLLSGFVANGRFCGGGMDVGGGGSMHDGVFDLTLLPHKGRVRNVAEAWRLYDGSVWTVGGVRRAYASTITAKASSEDRVLIDLDGEQPGTLPATFTVLPGALQVRGGWLRSPLLRSEHEIWRPAR
ncbi:MAG: hypothetical protein H6741_26235 [Alphaproteobacteria bacterium]|nr:hypothetical protein [Alphaproteobacteria bacterium]